MTRFLLIVAALFVLSLPAALAAPPAGKGKPEKPDKPGKSVAAPGQAAEKNAAKKCKAERASLGVEAFKAKYGTNANKANAFGKCVSGTSKKAGGEQDEAEDSEAEEAAAKKCKAERQSLGVDAFKAKYGTNANKANAFGKCVSKLSKKATS